MALDSDTNSVVSSEDRIPVDGGAWGTARLNFDLVAMSKVVKVEI